MAMIELEAVTKKFGGTVTAVDSLNLEINEGELVSLLGPSGCGKTTTLRMLAGFEKVTAGTIRINGQVMNDLPPQKRNIGIVFQDYAVFPTMSVNENVAYGLKLRNVTGTEQKKRVAEALELVGLTGFGERMPGQLSGGQLQRVALARALVIRPQVLLLDEPLSNLDAALRVSIRKQIRKIQQELKITTVFVTHDQEEAMSISDRVAVMKTAKLVQHGAPVSIYDDPATAFVAGFIGKTTLLRGKLESINGDSVQLSAGGLTLHARKRGELGAGAEVWISIRPQDLQYGVSFTDNPVTGKVDYLELLGSLARGEIIDNNGLALMFEVANPARNPVPELKAQTSFNISPDAVVYGVLEEDDREIFKEEDVVLARE